MNTRNRMRLNEYGWDENWAAIFEKVSSEGQMPARVINEQKGLYKLVTEAGDLYGEVSGRFRHEASGYDAFPSVGDWVTVDIRISEGRTIIHAVLPRRSKFSRKIAGILTQEQVLAANFDHVFIMNSLNFDLNPRRLERYLTMAWESGAGPVIVLSKKDLCEDAESRIMELKSITFGVPIIAVSSLTGEGVEELQKYFGTGRTIAVLGSSGVGKSTLTNLLAGEQIMETREIREDDSRGRHTTTFRQLVKLPGGGMIIDTPGMRELQLWESDQGLQGTFEDIESLGKSCRFKDCNHGNEPGCAIREAIQTGQLSEARLESYAKLKKELRFIESKHNQSVRLAEKKNAKNLSREIKKVKFDY